ncbi:MAG: (d)CMP kinase [Firmicutes bacterium]|nr:(d)CMP kinase [Bacillota bacterium]MCL1953587.1 (d)CMP kinase [Bacillota bacterium]
MIPLGTMSAMQLLSIRGATVCQNTVSSIESCTQRLYEQILLTNNLGVDSNISAVFVSMTRDLDACFAARGLRKYDVPMFSSVEPNIKGALKRCIRLLVQVNCEYTKVAQHIYLGGAKTLRPDKAKFVVAMDGPAGSGKSTLAKIIAQRLGVVHLDTGALYRAAAIKLIKTGVYKEGLTLDLDRLSQVLANTTIKMDYDALISRVYLDGIDISQDIREPNISRIASIVASNPFLRQYLNKIQSQVASQQSCVIDGRDIGTVIAPNADFKFFVKASEQERAKRRYNDLVRKGQSIDLDSVMVDMKERDYNDSTREVAPLYQASDAILVDTTDRTVVQSVSYIMRHIFGKNG